MSINDFANYFGTELRKRVAEVDAMSPINKHVVVASCYEIILRGTPGKSFGKSHFVSRALHRPCADVTGSHRAVAKQCVQHAFDRVVRVLAEGQPAGSAERQLERM